MKLEGAIDDINLYIDWKRNMGHTEGSKKERGLKYEAERRKIKRTKTLEPTRTTN